jgi:ABC-2 type transport system permease protein
LLNDFLIYLQLGIKTSTAEKRWVFYPLLELIITMLAIVGMWFLLLKFNPEVKEKIDINYIILYYFLILVIRNILNINYRIVGLLSSYVKTGEILRIITRPFKLKLFLSLYFTGKNIIRILTFLIVLVTILIFYKKFNTVNFFEFLIIAILGYIFFILLSLLISSLSFWFEDISSANLFFYFISALLGGIILPIEFYPSFFKEIVQFLPFYYLYYLPTKILIKGIPFYEFLKAILILLFYLLLLLVINELIWKKGMKKLIVYGG